MVAEDATRFLDSLFGQTRLLIGEEEYQPRDRYDLFLKK